MIVKGLDKALSVDARGKFGKSGGFGAIRFSYNIFGFHTKYAGIYSRKLTKTGWGISLEKFYNSENPRTIKQQNWRSIFKFLRGLWYELDAEQKKNWRLLGARKRMTGFNALMSDQLKNPRGGFGNVLFSWNAFGRH
jgi:hypothetical protein